MLKYNQFNLPIESALLKFVEHQSKHYDISLSDAFKLVFLALNGIKNDEGDPERIEKIKGDILDLTVKSNFKNELAKLEKWGIGFNNGRFSFPTIARFAETTKSTQSWGFDGNMAKTKSIAGLPVKIKGEASSALKLDVANAGTCKDTFNINMPQLDYGVSLRLGVAAGAEGAVSGTNGVFSGNFSAGGSFDFDLHYLYQFDGVDSALESLHHTFKNTASHKFIYFDLDSINNNLVSPQSGDLNDYHGLRRVEVNYKNSVNLSGKLGLGKSISKSEKVSVTGHKHKVSASISLGFSAGYESKLNGHFRTYCQKLSDNSLKIVLESLDEQSQQFDLALGADIKVSGLDELGKALIDGYLPYEQSWKSDLDEWSNLGDLLVQDMTSKLQSIAEDDAVWRSLVQTALGEDKSEEIINSLKEKVSSELSKPSDKVFNWLNDGTQQINQSISEFVLKSGLPTQLSTYLNDTLAQTVFSTINNANQDLQDKVKAKVESFAHKSSTEVRKWLEPLSEFGNRVDEFAEDINTYSQEVTEAVIDLLSEYQKLRQRLLEGAKKAAEYQVALQLGYNASKWTKESALLTIIIDPTNTAQENSDIVKYMMLGKVGSALELAQALEANGHPAIKSIEGELTSWSRQVKELKLGISFGKVNMYALTRKLSEINIKVDSSGNLLVGDVEAKLEEEAGFFHEERKLSVFSTSNIIKASEQNRLASVGGVSLALSDKNLRSSELQQFLYSLEERGLVQSGLTNRAIQLYNRKKSYGSTVVLRANMLLNKNFYKKLAQLGDEKAYELACNSFFQTSFMPRQNIYNSFNVLLNGYELADNRIDFIKQIGRKSTESMACKHINSNFIGNIPPIRDIRRKAGSHLLAVRTVRAVNKCAEAFTDMSDLLNELGESFIALKKEKPTDLKPWQEKLDDLVDELNSKIATMVSVKGFIEGLLDESVNWNTLAFLCLLADLNEGKSTKLTITLTIKNSDTEESFVLA
ncbi:hypothetical protein [Pseudoalteromonas luteoviolacea]|uniref:hypothetical protein n=1 Tax=Pseudoalteromonas luteoviolacea TaxID=43657 RepID=UPI00114F77FE|nr:hypothetical protein [Pseudoalteromonas luteoviolacea]TQF70740.1 hypothetical protein FLM44_06535 [Pseudoalteromonas luteoviolacea]